MTTALVGPFSVNEIAFRITRAVVSAGVPWGIAQEVGVACRWMCGHGMDPALTIVPALDGFHDGHSNAALTLTTAETGWVMSARGAGCLSALFAAPSAADWMMIQPVHGGSSLCVRSIDCPTVFKAIISSRLDGILEFQMREDGENLIIERNNEAKQPMAFFPLQGVWVNAEAWQTVERYFSWCLVPASNTSRLSGAGAGLKDED